MRFGVEVRGLISDPPKLSSYGGSGDLYSHCCANLSLLITLTAAWRVTFRVTDRVEVRARVMVSGRVSVGV